MNAPKLQYAPAPLEFPGIETVGSDDFARDAIEGLSQTPKALPCKYLYDAKGSALFDEITELAEYYPTRTELALTRQQAPSIAAEIGPSATVIEPGAGSTTKIRLLLDALETPELYVPIDISGDHLRDAAEVLRSDYPDTLVLPVEADFTEAFEVRMPLELEGPRVVYFPGSTIGNFERNEAEALLASFAAPLRAEDFLLVGWDRVKPKEILVPAYADDRGVTQDFIRNILVRMRDELGARVSPELFTLDTRWQGAEERIRISLRPTQSTAIELEGHRFELEAGEELFVEHSHKYSDTTMAAIAKNAGLDLARTWTDARGWFALSLFRPTSPA